MHQGLVPDVINAIAQILIQADQEGRQMLFEHEVYAVLSLLGLNVPNYLVVTEKEAITRKTMALFGSKKLVLKVISRDITHKQKSDGVKIIYKDLDFVRFTFDEMVSRLNKEGFHVEGILMVELVEYPTELGNEVLLGFRESEAFGPVISLSKGGSDAEHFATYFSPPNLILAPIDEKWSTALLASTKIQKKYIETGAVDYIAKIVDAEIKLSHLATAFSNYGEGNTRFCITEFEINPFIFDSEGMFIALDGYARFSLRKPTKKIVEVQPDDSITSFFEPHGIAVVGVSSSDTGKPGNIILKNLIGLNRNDVYGVNSISPKVIVSYGNQLDVDIGDLVDHFDHDAMIDHGDYCPWPVMKCLNSAYSVSG